MIYALIHFAIGALYWGYIIETKRQAGQDTDLWDGIIVVVWPLVFFVGVGIWLTSGCKRRLF